MTTYTPQEAALLPLILHRASESGDFMPLATQYLLISRSLGDQLSYGMHNSVVCAEDVPFYDPKTIDRKRLEQTYLGTSAVDGLRDICQVWPRGPIDKDFHEPLHSDVPALLLSGSDDPATPPADAEEALRGFTQQPARRVERLRARAARRALRRPGHGALHRHGNRQRTGRLVHVAGQTDALLHLV